MNTIPLTNAHGFCLHRSACIVYTWDYRSSVSVWHGFRSQPLLGDEVQTFKALISAHKIIRDGHPTVSLAVTVSVDKKDMMPISMDKGDQASVCSGEMRGAAALSTAPVFWEWTLSKSVCSLVRLSVLTHKSIFLVAVERSFTQT